MHRFFVPPDKIADKRAYLEKDEARHIEKVLRLKSGDRITLFDGTGAEYDAVLIGRQNQVLEAEIVQVHNQEESMSTKLSLLQGMAKGDKMDTIIQKAVEIGVSSIYPVICERTVVRLSGDRAQSKVIRWQQIAREACKQCRRNTIPEVKKITAYPELFQYTQGNPLIMLYENENETGLKRLLRDKEKEFCGKEIFILVGPEGGFAAHEVQQAYDHQAFMASLGPRILRTETAGLVAASIVLYEYGDLG